MLQFNLARIFKARGIDRPFSYLTQHGFTPSLASRIINSKVLNFNLHTIEMLCTALNCTPNDLLEWKPTKSTVGVTADHSLYSLKREDKATEVMQLINDVSLEKLAQIEAIIRKELEG
jgi:DNA-binding Xre family transcriptional regulator